MTRSVYLADRECLITQDKRANKYAQHVDDILASSGDDDSGSANHDEPKTECMITNERHLTRFTPSPNLNSHTSRDEQALRRRSCSHYYWQVSPQPYCCVIRGAAIRLVAIALLPHRPAVAESSTTSTQRSGTGGCQAQECQRRVLLCIIAHSCAWSEPV